MQKHHHLLEYGLEVQWNQVILSYYYLGWIGPIIKLKMKNKILISDSISDQAIEIFENHKIKMYNLVLILRHIPGQKVVQIYCYLFPFLTDL
mgnify:CR=1 FL=1